MTACSNSSFFYNLKNMDRYPDNIKTMFQVDTMNKGKKNTIDRFSALEKTEAIAKILDSHPSTLRDENYKLPIDFLINSFNDISHNVANLFNLDLVQFFLKHIHIFY